MPDMFKSRPDLAHAWVSLFLCKDNDLNIAFEAMESLDIKATVVPLLSFLMLHHPILSSVLKSLLEKTQSSELAWDDIKPYWNVFLSELEKGVGRFFDGACLTYLQRKPPRYDALYGEAHQKFIGAFDDVLAALYTASATTIKEMSPVIDRVNTEINHSLFLLRNQRQGCNGKKLQIINADITALKTVQQAIIPILLSNTPKETKVKNVKKLLEKHFKSNWLQDVRRVLLTVITAGIFAYKRHQKVSAINGSFFDANRQKRQRREIERLVIEPLQKRSKREDGPSGPSSPKQ